MKRWQKVLLGAGLAVVALGLVVKLVIFKLPPADLAKAAVGAAAPEFALPATSGAKVALSDLTKAGTAVVVFYRGDW